MSPEEELRFLILGAQREGNRLLAGRLAPLGVTPAQAEVVRCLETGGEMSLNALGRLLVCETGSPSRLVDTLVGRSLVRRRENPADRRQVTLRLTPAGTQLAADIRNVEEELHAWLRERLGAGDLPVLIHGLRELVAGTAAGAAIAKRRSGGKAD